MFVARLSLLALVAGLLFTLSSLPAAPLTPVAPAPGGQPPADGADPDPSPRVEQERVRMDERTREAVNRALRWLARNQGPNGAWGNNAITGFTLLAFMANGHLPNQGEYGPAVTKGVNYLLSCDRGNGFLGNNVGNHAMYCHGMATLALSQVYGMTGDRQVKEVLKRAIELIVRTQNRGGGRRNDKGGWRYQPNDNCGSDISVTIMQVMALRGAKDSGLHVPNVVMEEALKYITRCHDTFSGGYRYQPGLGPPGYARTAAGVCVLQLAGEYDATDIDKAVEYMEGNRETGLGGMRGDPGYYWYGHYYAAHALNQYSAKGEKEAKVWEKYYERMKTDLLRRQEKGRFENDPDRGRWYDASREGTYGPAYQTSIAVLILSVPTHYLPIYQK